MTPADRMAARFTRYVIVLALVGGVANLGGELAVPAESRSIRAHSSGSLGAILADEQPHVRERYQLYGRLRDLAAGATIVVPRDLLDVATLELIAGLDVEIAPNRRRITEGKLRLLPDGTESDVTEPTVGSSELYPYTIALASDDPDRLLVYLTRRTNTILIVDPPTAAAMELP